MLLFDPKCELHFFVTGQKQVVKDLHMDFTIEAFSAQGKKAAPNTAKISVYNLSLASRDMWQEEHQSIEFYAGYGDNIGLIFMGETTNVIHNKIEGGWRTDVYAGDGIKDFETKYFNKSYSKGTLVFQILKDLCAATDLACSIDVLDVDALLAGESYAGRVKDCLDSITKDRGLEWSIQHGVIEITQKDSPLLRDPVVVLLSTDTGLIGMPSIIDRTKQGKKKGKKTKRQFGVNAKSLMNWQIKPKRLVKITAQNTFSDIGKYLKEAAPNKSADGVYICDIVRYQGNNYGGEFMTEIEADLQ